MRAFVRGCEGASKGESSLLVARHAEYATMIPYDLDNDDNDNDDDDDDDNDNDNDDDERRK